MNLIAKRLMVIANQKDAYQKLKDMCDKIQKGIDDLKSHAEDDIANANKWIEALKNMQTKYLKDEDVQKIKDKASLLSDGFNDCFRYLLENDNGDNVINPSGFLSMIEQDSNNDEIGKTIKTFQDVANNAKVDKHAENVKTLIEHDVNDMINENMSLDELKKIALDIHNIAHFMATLDKKYNNLDDETMALMDDESFKS